MRKTADLVNEMLEEAKNTFLVAIAVGFSDDTRFVFSSAKEPLRELNGLVNGGGYPVGLLRFDKENGVIQGSYRPFTEYENEAWVPEYLAGLLKNTEMIVAQGRQQAKRPDY
jgi:hypothetical protein